MRTYVREDCMKTFKELGVVLNLRKLGESWMRKLIRADFMKEFKKVREEF